MTSKRIDLDIDKKLREKYNPPQGVDISWHDDGSCTVHYDNPGQLQKVKKNVKSTKELPNHARNPKHIISTN